MVLKHWQWDGWRTSYLQLNKGVSPAVVEKKMIPVVEKFTKDDMKKYNAGVIYRLQPLGDIHLCIHDGAGENGDGKTVYLFTGALPDAIVVRLRGWNYINLVQNGPCHQ